MPEVFVRCPHCGLPHEVDARACPTTGKPLSRPSAPPQPPLVPEVFVPQPGAPLRPATSDRPADGAESLLGRLIAQTYRVEALIGEGGMGTVYEAVHLNVGRRFAIKVLNKAHLGKKDAVTRFHREARAAGSIGHPNICQVYDIGRLPDGSPFLVMERLQGVTLADRISREGALPFPDVIQLLKQILSALAAAHAKKIIHRDIKPENVFLAAYPGGGITPKLLDFGISKSLDDSTQFNLTRTGMVMGTPFYMAPEQARGQAIDHRVDLWACSVMLYEMLTGKRPFQGDNYNGLVVHVLTAQPRDPMQIRPSMHEGFLPILEKGMKKNPNQRYQSANEFLQALAALQPLLPTYAKPIENFPPIPRLILSTPSVQDPSRASESDADEIPVFLSESSFVDASEEVAPAAAHTADEPAPESVDDPTVTMDRLALPGPEEWSDKTAVDPVGSRAMHDAAGSEMPAARAPQTDRCEQPALTPSEPSVEDTMADPPAQLPVIRSRDAADRSATDWDADATSVDEVPAK